MHLETLIEPDGLQHLIGEFTGNADGPTLIAVGSVHGNEPSGRLSLERVATKLESIIGRLNGRVFFLVGNVRALAKSVRYVDSDLNRHWTTENIRRNTATSDLGTVEDREQSELLSIFREILSSARDEVFVLDLHTTSAGGVPFATVGDTLRNRRFARTLPVTILLGIEEQLEGTMLEFLNNEGAVTLGFEAGQHASAEAIANHEALVWLALVNSGVLALRDAPHIDNYDKTLSSATGQAKVLEVRHREPVASNDEFEMKPGFKNFDPVKRGQVLGKKRTGAINASEAGLILMPLYQRQGEDGFFIVRSIEPFWLKVSEFLRRLNIADYIHLLPGVRRHPKHREALLIDTTIARFFPLQIFHLLGFRKLRWQKNFLSVTRRRHDTVSPFSTKSAKYGRQDSRK